MTDLGYSSNFFEIESKIKDYYEKISEKQASEIMKILDKQYIEENKITEQSVIEKIKSIDNYKTYTVNEIYVLQIYKDVI